MKTKAEILEILRKEKPELVRLYGLKRLALFGSYAREDQREDSDVDILVEIDPRSVSALLSSRTELKMLLAFARKSSRAERSSHVIGRSSKRTWLMSRRAAPLLIEDIWEAIEKIQRYVAGLNHDTFIKDDKTIDSVVRNLEIISEAANRLPEGFRAQHPRLSGVK